MRRTLQIWGTVAILGGLVGALVQVKADDEAPAPLPLTESARPLVEEGDAAPLRIDPQVRPSAGTATTRIAARRTGGLAGRLQAIRRDDSAATEAEVETVVTTPAEETTTIVNPAARSRAAVTETEPASEGENVAGLPSVLKRNGARTGTVVTQPAASSPSDETTVTTPRNSVPIRTAPSRTKQTPAVDQAITTTPGGTTVTTTAPAATTTGSAAVKRPSQRSQTLASGASASLMVETVGPKAISLGKAAEFVVHVANPGVTDATEAMIAITLPAQVELANVSGSAGDADASEENGQQRVMWKLDRIAGRAQEKLTLQLIAQSSAAIDLAVEWTVAPPQITTQIEVQEPKLQLALKGPKDVQYGDTVNYQIIVSNPGTGDAEDVVVNLVSEDATAADAKPIGTLPAGQQKIIDVSMTAGQAGTMKMHFAAVSGSLTAEASEDVLVRRAQLDAQLTAPALVYAGADATFQVKVTNTGDAPAENLQLGVLLPAGAEYLGGVTGVKANKSGQLVWTAGTLAAGATQTYEFTCLMTTAGTGEVQFQGKSGDVAASANAITKVEAVADLKLTVNDPQGPKPVGENVTYEVTITNRGTKAAKKVNVVINFSEGIDPVAVEGGKAELGEGQAVFQPLNSIEAGGEIKLKVTAKASKAGSHIFRAEVRCSDPETRLASEQTTRFFGSGGETSGSEAAAEPQLVPSTSAKPMGFRKR